MFGHTSREEERRHGRDTEESVFTFVWVPGHCAERSFFSLTHHRTAKRWKQATIHSALRGQNMRVRSLSLWPPPNSTPRPLPIELWSRTNLSDKRS